VIIIRMPKMIPLAQSGRLDTILQGKDIPLQIIEPIDLRITFVAPNQSLIVIVSLVFLL